MWRKTRDPVCQHISENSTSSSTNDMTGPPDPLRVPTLTVVVNEFDWKPPLSLYSIRSMAVVNAIYSLRKKDCTHQ